jgi:hypothetical protein
MWQLYLDTLRAIERMMWRKATRLAIWSCSFDTPTTRKTLLYHQRSAYSCSTKGCGKRRKNRSSESSTGASQRGIREKCYPRTIPRSSREIAEARHVNMWNVAWCMRYLICRARTAIERVCVRLMGVVDGLRWVRGGRFWEFVVALRRA